MRLNHVDIVDPSFSLLKDMTLTVDNGRISAIAKDILSVLFQKKALRGL